MCDTNRKQNVYGSGSSNNHTTYYTANYTGPPSVTLTELAADRWWGPGGPPENPDTDIREARVVYEDNMVKDLKQRLAKTRTNVQELEGEGFYYGFNQEAISKWTDYWLNQYDFAEGEAAWNKYPAYKTNIQGIDMFYYRIQPQETKNKEVIPLMMVHGWPSSPMDFFDIVSNMTAVSEDRDYVIDLILPCIPGFGFCEGAVRPGMDALQAATVLRNLMHRIGYKKFYIQGGDAGGTMLAIMATRFPDEVLGYHTNWGIVLSPVALFFQMVGQIFPSLVVSNTTSSRMYPMATKFNNLMYGTGYMHIHATRPDTLGIALMDSPIGLLGHILEKFSGAATKTNYARSDGGLFKYYDPRFLINTLMFYWSTGSTTHSFRLYSNYLSKRYFGLGLEQISTPVPTWNLAAPEEITYQSEPAWGDSSGERRPFYCPSVP